MHFHNYDESFINNFEANVNAITSDEAQRLINTYFPQDNLQFVIIGEAEAIRDQVKQYGELHEVGIQRNGFAF